MARSFPGGLRAQMLVVFGVLLIGAAGVAALLVENVLTKRLIDNRMAHARAAAVAMAALEPHARVELVDQGIVDGALVGDHVYGAPSVVTAMGGKEQVFSVDGRTYLQVRDGPVVVAMRVDDLQADVASTRGFLVLFGVLVLVVVLALGYGLFSYAVVRPIRALAVATERAGHGDYASQISVIPGNELGRLTTSFNEMLARIEQAQDALERKVEELQRTNTELAATRDSLVRSEKLASVGHLAAGIAHEIGNPLAAVSGFNELLLDGLDEDEARELLERTQVQLERIRGVIRNLLDFSRDERGAEPAAVDVAACVSETVSLVRPTAAKGVKFGVEDLSGPHAWGVGAQLTQVLVNLGINAADALGDHGRVVFSRDDDEAFVRILVDDDGPGISEELAERVFDPFFTTKEPGEGTGLGLAISARIMDDMGGGLTVESSPLGGARFIVAVPHRGER